MTDRPETLVRRPSRWARVRREWYRDAARTRIREDGWFSRRLFLAGTLLLLVAAATWIPEPRGWMLLALGLGASVVGAGLWACRLWAARIAGVLAAALALALPVAAVVAFVTDDSFGWGQVVYIGFQALIWGFEAVELLRPSKRELFRQARVGPPDAAPPA